MKEILIFWALFSLVEDLLAERPPLIQQVTFLSTNFENLFTWEHGKETPANVAYDVQYKTYGGIWQNKSECQNITQNFCNLTRETENYTERYYARVRAVIPNCCASDWITSTRFCPKEDTVVGVPEVKYILDVRSIKFIIHPSYTPLRDKYNRILTVEDIFSGFYAVQYEIIVSCEKTQQKWKKTENNKEFEIPELDPDTEYSGTICIKYSEKRSKPYEFRVRTLPEKSWLTYLFGVVVFMVLSVFGTLYYLIYKYINQYTTQQPMSLDFKDMSHFQPLTLAVEHILMPHDVSKPFQRDPDMKPEQIQHLQEGLEHPEGFRLPENVYQQQAKMPAVPCVAASVGQTSSYAPQVTLNSPPPGLDDKRSTLTYGVCVGGTGRPSKTNSSPTQTAKFDSATESCIGNGHPDVQKQNWNKEGLWGNLAPKELALALGKPEETQLRGDSQNGSQQETGPDILGERTGSYKQQPVELLPSALEGSQKAPAEGGVVPFPMTNSFFSHCAGNKLLQDPSLGHWADWNLSAGSHGQWAPSRCQVMDCPTGASGGLRSEPGPAAAVPPSSDSVEKNVLLPDLFRDLELKLQWDQGLDENAAIY